MSIDHDEYFFVKKRDPAQPGPKQHFPHKRVVVIFCTEKSI